eukprot:TRINITY_DN6324_c0_g2_i1.p1 TRINITY_DN6324_c0_g2~~TRINITY_DN6324_c0_g2_i1.p1  ORF type:complete len:1452 (+),score=316.33 TRINITY_DN6324_c0_g2_i1:333-4688(+)
MASPSKPNAAQTLPPGLQEAASDPLLHPGDRVSPAVAAGSDADSDSDVDDTHVDDIVPPTPASTQPAIETQPSDLPTEPMNSVAYKPLHPNLPSIRQVISNGETNTTYIVFEQSPFTLESTLCFSASFLEDPMRKLFLIYQLLHAVNFLHLRGIAHGAIKPTNILIDRFLWLTLTGFRCPKSIEPPPQQIPTLLPGMSLLSSLTIEWCAGKISNFDYLLALNELAGRRYGDAHFHPIMPWVIDFSSPNGGWRDLKKTKFRLAKGDEQLDTTFNSPIPHHIVDTLSELTYYIYMARRTPVELLCRHVRNNYVPNEYPASIMRMYEWTPDECIPEFFTNPLLFVSNHSDMPDLGLPPWAETPDDFVRIHRAALESDQVSQNLHFWIDLIFGFQLSGAAAVAAKNVFLPAPENQLTNRGTVQLFSKPHPPRSISGGRNANTIQTAGEIALALDEFEQAATFKAGLPLSEATHSAPAKQTRNPQSHSVPQTTTSPFVSPFDTAVAADMFAVGCVMSELHTHTPLFTRDTVSSYVAFGTAPASLAKITNGQVRKCVTSLIDPNPLLRPTAADILLSPLFPFWMHPLFKFCEVFMSLPNWKEKMEHTAEHKNFLLRLPGHGFQLVKPVIFQLWSKFPTVADISPQFLVEIFGEFSIGHFGEGAVAYTASLILEPLMKLYQSVDSVPLYTHLLSIKFIKCLLDNLGLSVFVETFLPFVLDSLRSPSDRLSAIASSTLSQLPVFLGSVVTLRFITEPLLRRRLLRKNSDHVVRTLVSIGAWLGKDAVLKFYLPQLFDLLDTHSVRAGAGGDTAMCVVLAVLEKIPILLSPQVTLQCFLTDHTRLFRLLLNPPSARLVKAVCSTLLVVAQQIGPEETRRHILPYLTQFFHTYSGLYDKKEEDQTSPALEEPGPSEAKFLRIFSPDVAHTVFSSFARFLGDDVMDREIANAALIRRIIFEQRQRNSVSVVDAPSDNTSLYVDAEFLSRDRASLSFSETTISSQYNSGHATQNYAEALPEETTTKEQRIAPQAVSAFSTLPLSVYSTPFFSQTAMSQPATPLSSARASLISPAEPLSQPQSQHYNIFAPLVSASPPASTLSAAVAAAGNTSTSTVSSAPLLVALQQLQSTSDVGQSGEWEPVTINDSAKHFDLLLSLPTLKERGAWVTQGCDEFVAVRKAHSSTIRTIDVHPSEQVFATGSSDRLVKIWSVGQRLVQRVYKGHKNSVSTVKFLENGQRFASCSGTIHICSTETGARLASYEATSTFVGVGELHAKCVVGVTSDPSIKFLDQRMNSIAREWKLFPQSFYGVVKSVCVDPQQRWIACGFHYGHVAVVDGVSGVVLSFTRPHEATITRIHTLPQSQMIVAGSERGLSLFHPTHDPHPTLIHRDPEVIQYMSIYNRHTIVFSTPTKLSVLNERGAGWEHRTLMTTKGTNSLMSFGLMPHHELLLAGSDSGTLRFCG